MDIALLRQELYTLLVEDLQTALNTLWESLPEHAEKRALVLSLQGRFKDANKERIRNTITPEDFGRRIDTIRADALTLLDTLEPADFAPAADTPSKDKGKAAPRQGSVLYRVPQRMPLQKPAICTIRIAVEEDALFEDIVLDEHVRLRQRVQVSDMMKAELLDPEGEVFAIRPLSEMEQLVQETGYTQWLFSVTPRVAGEHQLLIKVSMMEYMDKLGRYVPKEVSILENVTIVTEQPAPTDDAPPPFKSAGAAFDVGPTATKQRGGAQIPVTEIPAEGPNAPAGNAAKTTAPVASVPVIAPAQTSPAPAPQKTSGTMRTLAAFLAFLVLAPAAVWAFAPAPVRDFWKAEWSATVEAYDQYIEKYKTDPSAPARDRVEKARYRKAERSLLLKDLREYRRQYPTGQYRPSVLQRIASLEAGTIKKLREQPDSVQFAQYMRDFPDGERWSELRQIASQQPEARRFSLLQTLTTTALQTLQTQPDTTLAQNVLTTYPEAAARTELKQVFRDHPDLVTTAVQRRLETAMIQNFTQTLDPQAARALLEAFPQQHTEVERTAATSPALKKAVAAELRQAKARAAGETEAATRAWATASTLNTVEAYTRFLKEHPGSVHAADARERILTLRKRASRQKQQ